MYIDFHKQQMHISKKVVYCSLLYNLGIELVITKERCKCLKI